ncbi:MAG: pyridoxine 5'-phosphate synthase [Bacteroidia bacterium]|nr:pyridoxine 5'-phosphate synthase [Bacteroidia bacterium]MCZ2276375.1 pyridoxine 5'-phosphate synthase [Bacteroidia bacterium]
MIRLSVNINKIATLRNARGGNIPDVLEAAVRIQQFGADGITVHPRPDGRHIRYSDVTDLAPLISTEFNIEGYPGDDFVKLVEAIKPVQVTLVPDPPGVLTSDAGWNTIQQKSFLKEIISYFKSFGCRVSVFLNADVRLVTHAAETGTDRIELYTGPYAQAYRQNRQQAIASYITTAEEALRCNLGINAGHDLNLENLRYFAGEVPGLLEVSIGHALICDALYYGLENVIGMYKHLLKGGN